MMIERLDNGVLRISQRVQGCLETDSFVVAYIFTTKEQMRDAGISEMFWPDRGSVLGWIPITDEYFQSCARNVYRAVLFAIRQYAGNPHLLPEYVDITPLFYMGV